MNIRAKIPRETTCPHCRRLVDVSECGAFEEVECPDCDRKLTVPAEFGRFVLRNVAGSGNMGVVFKAWDASVNMPIALKVARAEPDDRTIFYDSLKAEIKVAGSVKHRNLIEIYDYGRIEGHPYVAMEYISGGTMKDRMNTSPESVHEHTILKWMMEAIEGLKAANAVGLVHGDLKPANILFDHNNIVKIADFGLARAEGAATNDDIWGTPMYIAPEKAAGKGEDARSDMYSMGIIMWQMLSGGTPPFNAPTAEETVELHKNGPIPDIMQTNPIISFHSSIILRRLMAKIPDRRFNTYDYLLAELRAAQKAAEAKYRAKVS